MGKTKVMIAGLSDNPDFGKMASLVAEYVKKTKDMELADCALAEKDSQTEIKGGTIYLVSLDQHALALKNRNPDVVVDFTNSEAVNRNAQLYCENETPFVMGTTGGDRELLKKTVEQSKISAVIAPNMAKQVVAFQAMMEYAAEKFPDVFGGYTLDIFESHQQGKKDTSGTAKAMVKSFNRMGIPFKKEQIVKIRDPEIQRTVLGIPVEHLTGHAWHTYTIFSKDGNIFFRFVHNINGRPYIRNTLDAIRFLLRRKEKGKVFSMIDVLSSEKKK